MNQPLVSVVMATYNCGQYITEAINSVINQTYPNIELIIVNDGSTDDTLETIIKLSQQTDNIQIKIICQENKGVAAAKNAGIQGAKGEYIAFLDADDLLDSDYIKRAVETMEFCGFDAVSFNFYQTDEKRNKLKLGHPVVISGFFVNSFNILSQPLPLGFLVVKRHFLTSKAHDERLTLAEDYDMWLRLLRGKAHWFFYGEPMAHYMLRQNSICHTYRKDIASQLWRIYRKHIDAVGLFKAWWYYRKHLARYRYAMLKKALRAKQPMRIVRHALIAARSPLFFPIALNWLILNSLNNR